MESKKYFPYKSDRPAKKFYIITNDNKKVYFGATGYEHFTEGHLNEKRRLNYMSRHKKTENWRNRDTPGFWSYHYLWRFPTYAEAYKNIKNLFLKD